MGQSFRLRSQFCSSLFCSNFRHSSLFRIVLYKKITYTSFVSTIYPRLCAVYFALNLLGFFDSGTTAECRLLLSKVGSPVY